MPQTPAVNSPITKDSQLCISLASRPSDFGTRFQNYLFSALELPFVYKASTTDDLEGAVRGIRALKIRGCAVSMPFKEEIIPFLDELDPSAKRIGAVNTVVNTAGILKAYNTDYLAVYRLIKKMDIPLATPIAVYGSGGMAKATVCALRELGYRDVTVLARNLQTGSALAETFGFKCKQDSAAFQEYSQISPFQLLINITPIGMSPNPENRLPFSEAWIHQAKWIFDVVAVPPETALILKAKALGKKTISGFEVVVIQAREQFLLYTGLASDLLSDELVEKAALFARSQ